MYSPTLSLTSALDGMGVLSMAGLKLPTVIEKLLNPMAARCKARVYGSSFVGILGSNSSWGTDASLLWMLSIVQVQISLTGRSLIHGSPIMCVCVCVSVWSGATIILYIYNKQVEGFRLRKKINYKIPKGTAVRSASTFILLTIRLTSESCNLITVWVG